MARRLLPIPPGPDEAQDALAPVGEQIVDGADILLPPDGLGVRGGHMARPRARLLVSLVGPLAAGCVESFGEEGGEVVGDAFLEFFGGVEGEVGGVVVGLDAGDEGLEAFVAVVGCLDVDEFRHRGGGEVVFVLEAGDLLVGGDPAVALPVDADEDVALLEVGAVEVAGWVGACAEFEHDGGQAHAFDRGARCASFVGELAQGRADEDPDPLIGRTDHGPVSPSHVHIIAPSAPACHAYTLKIRRIPAIRRRNRRFIPQHPNIVKNPAGHGASKDI